MTFALWLWGCSHAPEPPPRFQPPTVSGVFEKCMDYPNEEVFAYCIYQQAGSLYEIEDVHQYCPLSGAWEEACRHAWSVNRIHKGGEESLTTLLEGCAGYSDCTFEFIDARPSSDTNVQLKRCRKYVTHDRDSCIMHAMQMWANSQPNQEQVTEFLRTKRTLSRVEIKYVSEYQYCKSWNVCTEQNRNHQECRKEIQHFQREKHRCRRNWGKMPPRPKRSTLLK
ncbi:MAG: hypothetical protein VX278_00945 [Myxococcota bacterium]|nr:hypothetical protein [Myxococcota bacterium]